MSNKNLQQITDQNFEQTIKENKVVLVDFWATWCAPCRALAPTIEQLSDEYQGKVVVGKIDVDANPCTAEELQVFSIPTIVLFVDGKEVARQIGLCTKKILTVMLTGHIS